LELRELRYERLFTNALTGMGIKSRYFPVKSAANYSLLYLILRAVTELPARRVLELGCGQTTLLLDDLAAQLPLEVVTLEQDSAWADRIQERVSHRILPAPLVKKTVVGRLVETYAAEPASLGAEMDLLIIDGPVSERRHSRWGSLEYIEAFLSENMILIFDDAERKGEQDTILATLGLFQERGLDYAISFTRARKSQCLIATGNMHPARYF
jgi:predicted O-methyltransferase YrrM